MFEFPSDRPTQNQHRWWPIALALIGCVLVSVSASLLSLHGVVVVCGLLLSVLMGLVIRTPMPISSHIDLPAELDASFQLARDEQVFERFRRTTALLLKVSRHHDPIYRDIAFEQIDELNRRLTSIAAGSLIFEGTETWRIVYERLLRSRGLYLYRSVAWVRNAAYWQDEPGRKSMAVNIELQETGSLAIERIAILAEELWPSESKLPVEPIRRWLYDQHIGGINLKLVRASALQQEPALMADIGIYGSRALGTQELDDHGRTVRFVLTFDYTKVAEAEDRWNRLTVYAESVERFVDRYEVGR